MSVRIALYAHLMNTHTVRSRLGTNAVLSSPDLYMEEIAPASATLPRVTMGMIGCTRERHMRGVTTLAQATIGLVCAASNQVAVDELADAVRLALDGYRGPTLGFGSNTCTISGIRMTNDHDDVLAPIAADDQPLFQRVLIFDIWHRETAPANN